MKSKAKAVDSRPWRTLTSTPGDMEELDKPMYNAHSSRMPFCGITSFFCHLSAKPEQITLSIIGWKHFAETVIMASCSVTGCHSTLFYSMLWRCVWRWHSWGWFWAVNKVEFSIMFSVWWLLYGDTVLKKFIKNQFVAIIVTQNGNNFSPYICRRWVWWPLSGVMVLKKFIKNQFVATIITQNGNNFSPNICRR